MAWKKEYICTQCGYKAYTYDGRGFMGQKIVSMSCPDCKSIEPLVVGGVIGNVAQSFNSNVGRLCLRCGSDKIREWDEHTCPKCGGEMKETGNKEFWT